jgi:hypothetical protein
LAFPIKSARVVVAYDAVGAYARSSGSRTSAVAAALLLLGVWVCHGVVLVYFSIRSVSKK